MALAPVSTVSGIQTRLDKMVRSSGPTETVGAYGGIVRVAPGNHEWKAGKSVRLSSSQIIEGVSSDTDQGMIPCIKWLGGPGTSAFTIFSYTSDNRVSRPSIRNIKFECPNGGDAIGKDPACKTIDRLKLDTIICHGGGIILPGNHYGCVFEDIDIRPNKQAIVLHGFTNVMRGVRVMHGTIKDDPANKILGVCEFRGSTTFEGFCQREAGWPMPGLFLGDLVIDGRSYRGNFASLIDHDEHQPNAACVVVDAADFTSSQIGAHETWPWMLKRTGALHLQLKPEAGRVKNDGTGKVYVGGEDVTAEVVN